MLVVFDTTINIQSEADTICNIIRFLPNHKHTLGARHLSMAGVPLRSFQHLVSALGY